MSKRPRLGIDLLVVDEAHHLKRPPGHPGNPAYRAVQPIASQGRSVLLLTATPLEDDAHGFFPPAPVATDPRSCRKTLSKNACERRLPLPACASATRRADVGGLPPRLAKPVDLDRPSDVEGWTLLQELEHIERERAAASSSTTARKGRPRLSRRGLTRGSIASDLQATHSIRSLVEQARDADPRLAWLARESIRWQRQGQKTLIFVAHRESSRPAEGDARTGWTPARGDLS